MLKAHFDVIQCFSLFGRNFAEIREPQQTASETFRVFSEMHRNMEKDGLKMLKAVKPVLNDLGTYLTKAIPDTKLTIRRYADAKFTYLSYCLKVKELDDEEHTYAALQDPLYRVETGNYEYRLILRCRQEARAKFASLRNDVLEKLELLESKHAQDLVNQLRKLIEGLAIYSQDILEKIQTHPNLFPIEVDLKSSAFQYKSNQMTQYEDDDTQIDEIPIEIGLDALGSSTNRNTEKIANNSQSDECSHLLAGFQEINLNDSVQQSEDDKSFTTDSLLLELGIADINLALNPPTNPNNPDKKEQQQQQKQNEPNKSLENCIDWLSDEANAFSVDAIDDFFAFDETDKKNRVASDKNINLLD